MRPVTGRPFVQGQEARAAAEVDRALTLIRCLAPFSGDAWLKLPRRQGARKFRGAGAHDKHPQFIKIPAQRVDPAREGVRRDARPGPIRPVRGHL